MNKCELKIDDLWELNDFVEQVVVDMRSLGFLYTEDGENVGFLENMEERIKLMKEHMENEGKDSFNFIANLVLKEITFKEAVEMDIATIYEKYLSEADLKKVRGILRKDSRLQYGMIVSEDVSDDILNQIIAIRWKENLKLWALHREAYSNILSVKGTEMEKEKEEKLASLANVVSQDIVFSNSMFPKFICSERDGYEIVNYYYWHHQVGNIRSITFHDLPNEKLQYRYRYKNNQEEKSASSINEILEAIAKSPEQFSISGYETDYSIQERRYIGEYRNNMRKYMKTCWIENEREDDVLELPGAQYIGACEVGTIVLLSAQEKEALIACGWNEYITKIRISTENIEIIETNLKYTQLEYTKAVIMKKRLSILEMLE